MGVNELQVRPRTDEEIIERLKAPSENLGFEKEVLIRYAPLEAALEAGLFKEGVTLEELKEEIKEKGEIYREPTRANLLEDMQDYMEFAWEKALDHRGISAMRSMVKMLEWLWLLDEEYVVDLEMSTGQYGAAFLKVVCDHYGLKVPTGEKVERMIAGQPCVPDCDEGCQR